MTPTNLPDPPDIDARRAIVTDLKRTMDALVWKSLQVGIEALKSYDLTLPQVIALQAIIQTGPNVDMGTIVEATGLPASTLTSVADRLLQRGLIQRTPHPSDRRRVQVSATETGKAMKAEMDQHDIEAFIWLTRDIEIAQLEGFHRALQLLQVKVDAATLQDFEKLRPGSSG